MGQDESTPSKNIITTADNSELPEPVLQVMTTEKLGYVYIGTCSPKAGGGRWK